MTGSSAQSAELAPVRRAGAKERRGTERTKEAKEGKMGVEHLRRGGFGLMTMNLRRWPVTGEDGAET